MQRGTVIHVTDPALRIFISSPGDVGEERVLAARVIERLQGEFANSIKLEPILWEHVVSGSTGPG